MSAMIDCCLSFCLESELKPAKNVKLIKILNVECLPINSKIQKMLDVIRLSLLSSLQQICKLMKPGMLVVDLAGHYGSCSVVNVTNTDSSPPSFQPHYGHSL